jgi:hypothetical protein
MPVVLARAARASGVAAGAHRVRKIIDKCTSNAIPEMKKYRGTVPILDLNAGKIATMI